MYSQINEALISDDENLLKKYMPLIRAINKYIVHPMEKKMNSYRGSQLTQKQFEAYVPNKVYRSPMYVSSSTDREAAISFKAKKLTTLITYNIPKGVYNGREISKFSFFPHEKELLFPPYTAFKVKKIIVNKLNYEKPNELIVEILDNKIVEKLENEGVIFHQWDETHDGYDLKQPQQYEKK